MENKEAKNWNNFFLGLAVIVLPFLGLPLGFKKVLFVLAGVLISLFSLANVRHPQKEKENYPNDQTVVQK